MAREDWDYVNLDKTFMKVVEKAVKSIRVAGVQKYHDKKDFIVKATIAQLNAEGFAVEEKEVAAR